MQDNFNLLQAAASWRRGWRTILLFTLLAAAVTTVTVFLVPQYYRGTVTVVSANPLLADKARFFNNNIQGLYSYFGSGDDLDRIQGIAGMDTTFKKLVDEFALIDYYHPSDNTPARKKAAAVKKLRKDISFQRTEEGQLKITAWMKEASTAAAIANRMAAIVTETEEAIWQQNYTQASQQLLHTIADMELAYQRGSDSLPLLTGSRRELAVQRLQNLLEQLAAYRKAAGEFTLAGQAHPAVMYVLEPATPAAAPTRPDKAASIILATVAAFIFSSLAVLLKRRSQGMS